MRFLELRRHATRTKPDEHLSQKGITLARRIGEQMGPFDLVISSPSPRAFETAIAMGFAVDEYYEPVHFGEPEWLRLDELMPEGTAFEERARAMKRDGLAARYADALLGQWTSTAGSLPPGGCALVVTHGGYLDVSAVACLPDARHRDWGANFGNCEGIRLTITDELFTGGQLLRVTL